MICFIIQNNNFPEFSKRASKQLQKKAYTWANPWHFLCSSETDFAIEWKCNPGSSRLFSTALKKDYDVFAVLGIELLCVSSKFIWTDFRRLSWQSGFDATLALKCSPMDANATCLTSQPLKLHQHYMYDKLVTWNLYVYSGSILLVFRLMWF